jgi:hypothetical protein
MGEGVTGNAGHKLPLSAHRAHDNTSLNRASHLEDMIATSSRG